ncbi:MAG: hypothetical protein HY644_02120 [Acidobacteria bacterium]|nr:hypothetical protein [Acidobacteriota bacterium]
MSDVQPSLSHLKTFCALRNCTLRVGHREIGFLEIDADGILNPRAFSSFNPAGEMMGRPNPASVLSAANEFIVRKNGATQTLNREEFLKLLEFVVKPIFG